MADMVNHPKHYADKKIEVIEYIFDTLSPEGATDYCIGNVLKYTSRWRKKGGIEDLEKAQVYLQWAIECARREQEPEMPAIEEYPCVIGLVPRPEENYENH